MDTAIQGSSTPTSQPMESGSSGGTESSSPERAYPLGTFDTPSISDEQPQSQAATGESSQDSTISQDAQVKQPEQPVTAETQPELLLGKFKTAEELQKAYVELEAMNTRTAQERAEAQKQVEQYNQQAQAFMQQQMLQQQQQAQQQQQTKENEVSPYYDEWPDQLKQVAAEKFKERYEDNPLAAVYDYVLDRPRDFDRNAQRMLTSDSFKQYISQIAKDSMLGYAQQAEYNKSLESQFLEKNPHMSDYAGDVKPVIDYMYQNGLYQDLVNRGQHPYDFAYNYVRGIKAQEEITRVRAESDAKIKEMAEKMSASAASKEIHDRTGFQLAPGASSPKSGGNGEKYDPLGMNRKDWF